MHLARMYIPWSWSSSLGHAGIATTMPLSAQLASMVLSIAMLKSNLMSTASPSLQQSAPERLIRHLSRSHGCSYVKEGSAGATGRR